MEQAFMFAVLDEKERDIVIGAMEECRFKYYFFFYQKKYIFSY